MSISSLKPSLSGQGYFETPDKFRLKIPERGFGSSFSVTAGLRKSFITSDLAWTLTLVPPQNSLCAGPSCLAAPAYRLTDRGRRCSRHDA